MFIEFLIDLVGSYFSDSMFFYWFMPMLILAFLATVPLLISRFFRR